MQSRTHIASSLSMATIPFYLNPNLINFECIPYFISGVVLGSLLPDIDEPNSSIGRKTIGISHLINFIFRHRGFTHKFIFFLIPLLLAIIFENNINDFVSMLINKHINKNYIYVFLISFSFGILFHQIGDMLSGGEYFKGGIKDYFYPFISNGKYFTPFPKIFRCAVGDWKEKIYYVLFISFLIYEIFHIITVTKIIPF